MNFMCTKTDSVACSLRFIEEITKEIEQLAKQSGEEKSDDNRAEIEEKKCQLKLLLIINRLDQQLLNQSIAQISR